MISVGVSDITHAFGTHKVLDGITFSVNEGERVGVIGVNGVGKTTLLRIICGELTADTGQVSLAKGASVGMLEQMTDLSEMANLTLLRYMELAFPHLLEMEQELERLSLEMTSLTEQGEVEKAVALSSQYDMLSVRFEQEGGHVFRGKCRSMLARLGFAEEVDTRKVASVSGGQHTRLALARLLAREPDVLLLDEPTNHLDIDALTWLEGYLADYPKTTIIVSHDRYFLDKVTNKTLHISHGHATLYHGNYTAAKAIREADEASHERRRKEQMKIRARIEANIAFQRRCGQEHNFVTIRSKQKQLDRMEVLQKTQGEKVVRMRFDTDGESAANVLTVRDLTFGYGAKPLFSGLRFDIRRGERVLFLGGNGTGKSTLMKLLSGMLVQNSGHIDYGYRVTVGYYDQEMRELDPSHTIMEEIHATFPTYTHLEIRSALALFLFGAEDIDRKISHLSGGERARVLLCKLMLKKVNVLILDEPTNHLDITSREALETALSDYEGTVIAVSHDRYFINRIASRIIVLSPQSEGGILDYLVEDEEGAYAYYQKVKEFERQLAEAEVATATPTSAKAQYEQQKKARADRQSEARKMEQMKKRVAELEEKLAQIEAEMADPAVATDYVKTTALYEAQQAAEEELMALYEQIL